MTHFRNRDPQSSESRVLVCFSPEELERLWTRAIAEHLPRTEILRRALAVYCAPRIELELVRVVLALCGASPDWVEYFVRTLRPLLVSPGKPAVKLDRVHRDAARYGRRKRAFEWLDPGDGPDLMFYLVKRRVSGEGRFRGARDVDSALAAVEQLKQNPPGTLDDLRAKLADLIADFC